MECPQEVKLLMLVWRGRDTVPPSTWERAGPGGLRTGGFCWESPLEAALVSPGQIPGLEPLQQLQHHLPPLGLGGLFPFWGILPCGNGPAPMRSCCGGSPWGVHRGWDFGIWELSSPCRVFVPSLLCECRQKSLGSALGTNLSWLMNIFPFFMEKHPCKPSHGHS